MKKFFFLLLLTGSVQAAQEINQNDMTHLFNALRTVTPDFLLNTAFKLESWRFTSTADGRNYWAVRYIVADTKARYCLIFDSAYPIIMPTTFPGYWNFTPFETNMKGMGEAMMEWCVK